MPKWIASLSSSAVVQDNFLGGEVTNLLFKFCEGSNDKNNGGGNRKKRFYGEMVRIAV